MADKEGFLHRWSARKAEARDGVPSPEPDEVEEQAAHPESDAGADGGPEGEPESAPDLPDVETLDASSDYTAFLGSNVPQDVANLALRKLWRSDPVLANLDGLNDYDDDFSKVGMVSEVVKTIYKVGKGFITAEDEAEKDAALEDDEAGEVTEMESLPEDDAPKGSEEASDVSGNSTPPDGEGTV